MKVALIPLLYKEYNYGGLLQFYALQKAVLKLGVDAEILHVSAEKNICKNKSVLQRIKSFFSFPKRLFYQIKKKKFFQNNYAERIKKTMEFRRARMSAQARAKSCWNCQTLYCVPGSAMSIRW